MITEITIENFKPFGKPQTIPLKPITLLYGPNSSGKSSIIQLLLMIKQTLESPSDDYLVTSGSLVELGDYKNIIHKHDLSKKLGVGFMGKNCWVKTYYRANSGDPEIDTIEYFNSRDQKAILQFKNSSQINKELDFEQMTLNRDVTFNIFDLLNKEHPRLKYLYNSFCKKINLIIIPIEGNLLKVFGKKMSLDELKQMTIEKFVKRNSKKRNRGSSLSQKKIFKEELEIFYKSEVALLLKVYLKLMQYSYAEYFSDLTSFFGSSGHVYLNKILLKMKYEDEVILNLLGMDHFTRGPVPLSDKKVRQDALFKASNNNLVELMEGIDPAGFIANWDSNDWDEEILEYDIERDEKEQYRLKLLVNKLQRNSGQFSHDLDMKRLTQRRIMSWYKKWGHLGSEKYYKLKFNCPADINKYSFSKYYKSVSEYLDYIRKEYFIINLRSLVNGVSSQVEDFLGSIEHIAPLRALPERIYFKKEVNKKNIMNKGEDVPQMLFESSAIEAKLNSIFELLGIEYTVQVKRDKMSDSSGIVFSVELIDKELKTNVNISDIGQGVSQILPVIIAGIQPKSSNILIQQPEIHLHPRLQAELGTFIAQNIGNRKSDSIDQLLYPKKFIIETHSEGLILRFQKLLREKMITLDDIAVLYIEKDGGETTCKELRLDENGEFLDAWPGGFFEEGYREMFE